MTYQAPVRDYAFLLRDVLQLERYANLPAFADASMDTVEAILDEAGKFTSEVLAPLNAVGDKEGCRSNPDFTVTTPKGFKAAYEQLVEAGWPALGSDPAYGGQGLPHVVNVAFSEMMSSANMAFAMYPGLTHGCYSAIHEGGSDAQKELYLPKLASFQWARTMNLTEPHSGTDLGLLRTKAVPQADGTYRISGQKIWISGGEQDLTENIIHLVLARIEGAPQGTRGISLFIVPKFIPDADGNPGERNAVKCLGLEEKMGIHGNATCVISHEEATGWLIGEENRGLAIMFVMMNEARLGVGMQGVAQAEAAYQAAAEFAKDRLQGRSLTGPKNPDGPADPIIVHPDVRRMLLTAKAYAEGGRAFSTYVALQIDRELNHPDEQVPAMANQERRKTLKTFPATDREKWSIWLKNNHASEKEVWLVFPKGHTGLPCMSYDDALDEALCHGWIDSLIKRIDDDTYARKFTPRSDKQNWSELNKKRVARLIEQGRMTDYGLAKVNYLEGSSKPAKPRISVPSTAPEFMERALRRTPTAWRNFQAMAPSHKRNYILWVTDAKRDETRERRLEEAVLLLKENKKVGLK